MVTIRVEIFLSNSDLYEHRCLENIKKLYKSDGKYDDQQKYRDIIESSTVSTIYGINENTPMAMVTSGTMKNPSARIFLSQF